MIDTETSDILRFAAYARESHLWPMQGGALDQTSAFLAAEQMIRRDIAAIKAERGGRG